MSHSLALFPNGRLLPLTLTIIDYALGGEAVAVSELSAFSLDVVVLGTVPPGQNSLGVPLIPVLVSGKIVLYRFVSGSPVEIPATVALNAVVPALVHSSACISPL